MELTLKHRHGDKKERNNKKFNKWVKERAKERRHCADCSYRSADVIVY